jgi:hypothetical protein
MDQANIDKIYTHIKKDKNEFKKLLTFMKKECGDRFVESIEKYMFINSSTINTDRREKNKLLHEEIVNDVYNPKNYKRFKDMGLFSESFVY